MPQEDPALVEEGLAHCRRALERYDVLGDPAWADRPLVSSLPVADRGRVRRYLGELMILSAQARIREAGEPGSTRGSAGLTEAALCLDRAEACFEPAHVPRPLLLARADLLRLQGRAGDEEGRLRARAESLPPEADADQLLFEDPERLDSEQRLRLVGQLDRLAESDPQNWASWIAIGNWNIRIHRPAAARAAYDVAVALAPRSWPAHFLRGLLSLDLNDPSRALEDFDRVLAARPDLATAYLNRALAKLEMGDAQGAVDDSTTCLEKEGAPSRGWFIRARARQRLGDLTGAASDREAGLKRQPRDPDDFVARGLARLPLDTQGALADFDAALALDPRHVEALQDKASLLGETLGRPEEALKVLDRLLSDHPERVQALCGRGVQLARFGAKTMRSVMPRPPWRWTRGP